MKGNCHQCRIIRFPKIPILKNRFGSSVDKDVADRPYLYTECPRRNGQNFWRVFLRLNFTDITQNTYIQS